ncbi:DNA photolyase-like FAD binding protein [Shimia abyssi]|uniref:DNA photolyase-like FAD binding protein n=1 Tax=Shimia abyssi TaxID=1662395 RepID=A0A2P8F7N8_9RHOB|nr:DNA photolyase-like FAD binding protein [Shimia abyssi]
MRALGCRRIWHGAALSLREVVQATWARQREVKARAARDGWSGALSSFSGRLHCHCHFIQKLEDAPRIEFENLHRGYVGIRPSAPDTDRLAVWARGETGLPFVDACMRSLRATGWLNFRMRAMVMAVASYHLWLHWRAPGLELARLFTDYEPGIHYRPRLIAASGVHTVFPQLSLHPTFGCLVPQLQTHLIVKPVDPLGFHLPALPSQKDVDAPVSIAHTRLSYFFDACPKFDLLVAMRSIMVGRAMRLRNTAGAANADAPNRPEVINQFPAASRL